MRVIIGSFECALTAADGPRGVIIIHPINKQAALALSIAVKRCCVNHVNSDTGCFDVVMDVTGRKWKCGEFTSECYR